MVLLLAAVYKLYCPSVFLVLLMSKKIVFVLVGERLPSVISEVLSVVLILRNIIVSDESLWTTKFTPCLQEVSPIVKIINSRFIMFVFCPPLRLTYCSYLQFFAMSSYAFER